MGTWTKRGVELMTSTFFADTNPRIRRLKKYKKIKRKGKLK